jgi:hypothetical protein
MKYRYHNEFLPMDGTFNIMFIRPDQSISPQNMTIVPSNKISSVLKYKITN